MKSIFAIVDSLKQGRCIIYWQEDQLKLDPIFAQIFSKREGENQDILTYKDNIKSFFEQTQYFGLVQENHFLGFTADFMIDFFDPTKTQTLQELMIEDNIFLTKSLQFKEQQNQIKGISIVFMLKRESQSALKYAKFAHQFILNSLNHLEEESEYLTSKALRTLQLMEQFENRIMGLIPEFEKQKPSLADLKQQIRDAANEHLQQCELRKLLNSFFTSIQQHKQISFLNFNLMAPDLDLILTPKQVVIKPYETILTNLNIIFRDQKHISPRFQKFMLAIKPIKSFQELSISDNFSMGEIQTYVNHLLIIDNQQISFLMNKINDFTYFVINQPQNPRCALQYSNKYNYDVTQKLKEFNKPTTFEQLKKQTETKVIFTLIGYKYIRQCQVYLYKVNPFLTDNDIDEIIKTVIQDNCQHTELEKMLKNEKQSLSKILKYLGKQIHLDEIQHLIEFSSGQIWKYIKKYDKIIGYYIL